MAWLMALKAINIENINGANGNQLSENTMAGWHVAKIQLAKAGAIWRK